MEHLAQVIVASASLLAVSAQAAGPEAYPPAQYGFRVTGLEWDNLSGDARRMNVVNTDVGPSAVREADYVVNGYESRLRLTNRVPDWMTRIEDLDAPESGETSPSEFSVMFGRGYSQLSPGPDIFVMDASMRSRGVVVTPVYKLPDNSLVHGAPVEMGSGDAFGRFDAGGVEAQGVGIDLDAWLDSDDAPDGAQLAGAVIRQLGDDTAPIKVVLGEAIQISDIPDDQDVGGGFDYRNHYKLGGAVGGANPGAQPDRRVADEIPTPGAAALFAIAGAVASSRRRRPS